MAVVSPQKEGPITGINVTPLVDVVLVLLIILMVTAGYIVSKTIPVELPKSTTGQTTNLTFCITIDAKGRNYLDAEPIGDDGLRERIRQAHRQDPETRAIIAADGATRHKNVVAVIDLLRQEGITRFAINVQPQDIQNRKPEPR